MTSSAIRRLLLVATIGALFAAALLAPKRLAFAQPPAASTVAITAAPNVAPASQPAGEQESKFLRYVADPSGHGASLQASVVRYANEKGVTVDLIAAIHIADRSFFKSLDASFADYDAVLYELVAPSEMLTSSDGDPKARHLRDRDDRDADETRALKRKRPQRSLSWVGSLQQSMKELLDLTFQLEEIDYHRPNFVHADLDAETFEKMQSDRGESIFSLMLDQMMRGMSDPKLAEQGPGLMDLLVALRAPDRPHQLKLLLGKMFGQLDEQMAGFNGSGDEGSVLVTERNKAALSVLKQQMSDTQKKSFAIFYGAAHLKGMDKVLTEQMGFHQVGPPFWRVAWDMNEVQPTTKPTNVPAQAK